MWNNTHDWEVNMQILGTMAGHAGELKCGEIRT